MEDLIVKDVLVRSVPISALDKIKARAKRKNTSFQSEMIIIINEAANRAEPLSELELVRKFRASLTKVNKSDSVELLREDRNR